MKKVLATDLDGTLFYPKDKKNLICKKNLFFIQSFIDNGGELIIASGRSLDFGKKVQKVIGRSCTLVCYNGGLTYRNGKIIDCDLIDNNIAKEIIDIAFEDLLIPGVFLMTDKGTFIRTKSKSTFIRWCYKVYYSFEGGYAEDFDPSPEAYEEQLAHGKINKIMIFFGLGKKANARAANVNKIFRETMDNIESCWSATTIEISPKDCSKGNAIKRLCELESYDADDVFVVGDSGNDISMFKNFNKNSFCMGHASSTIKKYAKYTIDNFEDLSRYIYEK